MSLQWFIEFDWSADGTYEDDVAVNCYSLRVLRGRERLVRTDGAGFARGRVGRATLDIYDADGRLDPFNTSSPLYPDVTPGKRGRIRVRDIGVAYGFPLTFGYRFPGTYIDADASEGVTYTLLTGRVDDIQPLAGGERRVRITLADGWRELRDRESWIDLVSNTNTATALATVASDAAVAETRITGDGDDLTYWWVGGQSSSEAALELAESNWGQLFFGADGALVFNDRQSRLSTEQEGPDITQEILRKPLRLYYRWSAVRNQIRIQPHPRTLRTSVELYRLYDVPRVNAGDTLTIWSEYVYNNRAVVGTNVVTPVAVTDYTANTAADGSGTDITSDISVTLYAFGTSAKIVVHNTGADNGYLTLLTVRGDAIDEPTVQSILAEDAASQATYGTRALRMDLPWLHDLTTAQSMANWMVSWLSKLNRFVSVQIETRPGVQFAYDLYARVHVVLTTLDVDADFYIGAITHEWISQTGQGILTTWQLEPGDVETYWRFATLFDVSSRFGY